MDTSIILVVIIVFSFVASRALKRYAPSYFAFSGAEYLALGVVLGPMVTGFVSADTRALLEPVIQLLLGLVGFTLGLMLREHVSDLRALPSRVLTALVAISVPAAGCYGFLSMIPDLNFAHKQMLVCSLIIGVVACMSSVTRIDAVARLLRADGWVTRNLRSSAVINDALAVLLFGALATVLRADKGGAPFVDGLDAELGLWLLASTGVGVVCGLLFAVFLSRVRSAPETFLGVVGGVIFASGMATGLGVSPLFVNMIVGVTVVVFSTRARDLLPVIQRLEHPSLVLLLIFAGIVWVPVSHAWLWVFVPLYLLLRFVGLRLGTALSLPLLRDRPPARRFGNGLLAQGIIAVALALDFALLEAPLSQGSASFILTTLLLSTLAQDFLSTRALRRVLADAEEIYTDMLDPNAQEPEPADEHPHGHGHGHEDHEHGEGAGHDGYSHATEGADGAQEA